MYVPFDQGRPDQGKDYVGFETCLAQNRLAPAKCISYMGNWVRSFSKYCGHSLKDLTLENMAGFLSSLAGDY